MLTTENQKITTYNARDLTFSTQNNEKFSKKFSEGLTVTASVFLLFKSVVFIGRMLSPKSEKSLLKQQPILPIKADTNLLKVGLTILLGLGIAVCLSQMYFHYGYTRFIGTL
jgi:hypothetical protein